MSVTLRKRKNADGSITLRLDIYHNSVRSVETLKNLRLVKPVTSADRESNKEKMQMAERIALTRATELQANHYSMAPSVGKNTSVVEWMESYIAAYTKKDKRNMKGALKRFVEFLGTRSKLTFPQLDALLIEGYMDYLERNCTGEGPSSYYNRFKKMIKNAYRKKLMKENVLDQVEKRIKGKAKKKDVLTLQELKTLNATETNGIEVKRGFLFSCVTGLRWIDLKALTWSCVRLDSNTLHLTQSKTSEETTIPLNMSAIKLLGTPGKPDELVFSLPTADGANATLKDWVKRAGIAKKITWHNGRHSFGTNLILNNIDVLTTSKLLGHTSMKHTQRYVNSAEEMKRTGTDKINIDLGG